MNQPFIHRLANSAGTAGIGNGVLPLFCGLFLEQVLNALPPHLDGVRADVGPVQVLEVLDPLRTARGLQELAGEALVHAVVLDVAAVGTFVLVRHHVPGQLEQVRRIDVVELGQVPAHGREHGAVERHLDALPSSGPLAGDKGHGHRD